MTDVCVVGFVYFELAVPASLRAPDPGTEVFVERLPVRLGGALNTASVVRALGHSVTLASPQGDGVTDHAIDETLRRLGIGRHPWRANDDPAISLVFDSPGDRAFLSAADFDAFARCPPLPAARFIHVPGLAEARRLARRLAEARRDGARISVSGSWVPEELAALGDTTTTLYDLLVVNEKEALAVRPSLDEAFFTLLRASRDVVVTRGAKGAVGVVAGKRVKVPGSVVEVVDFTGAGDAFSGGLVAGLLQNASPERALELGVRAATRILAQAGGVASPEAFKEFS